MRPNQETVENKEEGVLEEVILNQEDDEYDSKERVLHKYFLQEWKLLNSLIDDTVSNGCISDPSSIHKFRSIVDKYQEQGQLLEPYLESMVSPLMSVIRSRVIELGVASDEILEIIKPICIIIYSLVTVCGYKSVIKFFPHQVSDLELAVSLLEKCHHTISETSLRQESTGEMEAKCVMLLWLYILVLAPFDIVLLQNANLMSEDRIEKAIEFICETCWDGDMDIAKHQRLELYETIGLEVAPLGKNSDGASSGKSGSKKPRELDENRSYSSLVESSGF